MMSWKEVTKMSQRMEFIMLAINRDANMAQLAQQFNISRKTAYKWLKRYQEKGMEGLEDESRRPHHSPNKTKKRIEQMILEERKKHPAWGARKLKSSLKIKGYQNLPTASTITSILHRNDCIHPMESQQRKEFIRFERAAPNDLWQVDFKGHFPLIQGRCHPLTMLDDHSRFSTCLQACANETHETVKPQLICTFRHYGMPDSMCFDNGSPWGTGEWGVWSELDVWLMLLGIRVIHTRPYHPQTNGKDERFHLTLKKELLVYQSFRNLKDCQKQFDQWRYMYNTERPHEAIGMMPPSTRYQRSQRIYPEQLPKIEYMAGDSVRKVDSDGRISFHNHTVRVGKALRRQWVAIRSTQTDGIFHIFFCQQKIKEINLHKKQRA